MTMSKRTAFIGLSYPLLYDYKHPAEKSKNDLISSPNPIIESPLGLMILYDEILFLCRSVCPNNMRNLPYVKFVDELYPDFYFQGCMDLAEEKYKEISEENWLDNKDYEDIVESFNIREWGPDGHTHGLKIGDITTAASSNQLMFLFDLFVFQALQNTYHEDIEFITNRKFISMSFDTGARVELIDKIIIPGIPNYLGVSGPYHKCMEELRENEYITDFRKWIIKNHSNLQRQEINERCKAVENSIEEVRQRVFRKYLENNSGYSFFTSTGETLITTTAGIMFPVISGVVALKSITQEAREARDAKSVRWQGFVMDSRNIVRNIN